MIRVGGGRGRAQSIGGLLSFVVMKCDVMVQGKRVIRSKKGSYIILV